MNDQPKGIVIDFKTRKVISNGHSIDQSEIKKSRLQQAEDVVEKLREQLLVAIESDPTIDPSLFVFFTLESDTQRPGAILENVRDLQALTRATTAVCNVFLSELANGAGGEGDTE